MTSLIKNTTLNNAGYLAGATRFKRIATRLSLEGDHIYKDAGIKFKASWFGVFYLLANNKNPQSVNELTQAVGYTNIAIKDVVAALLKEGLVTVKQSKNDKRKKEIKLSVKGKGLLIKLKPLWIKFTTGLESILSEGHPDIINILDRIDNALTVKSLKTRIDEDNKLDCPEIKIFDYNPDFKSVLFDFVGNWLLDRQDGILEPEDEEALKNPNSFYLDTGGSLFFAVSGTKTVGCVALKRLSAENYEFCKLFVHPDYRQFGIATKLIHKCIGRSVENHVNMLFLQTVKDLNRAQELYYKLGFKNIKPIEEMDVLGRTDIIMGMKL